MRIDSGRLIKERQVEEALDGASSGVSALAVFVNRYVKLGTPHAEQRLEALRTLIELDVGMVIAERRAELQGLKEGALKRIKEGVAVMNPEELTNLERHMAAIFRDALAEIPDDGGSE